MLFLTLFVFIVAVWCMCAQPVPSSSSNFSPTEKLKWLAKPELGFVSFQEKCNLFVIETTESELEKIIPKEDFDLLYACLEEEKDDFTAEELSRLIFLSDYYMASEKVVNQVFDLYWKFDDRSKIEFNFNGSMYADSTPKGIKHLERMTKKYAIRVANNEVVVVDCIEKNEFSECEFLKKLVLAFNSLVIKNLSITGETLPKLQAILTSNLKFIKFENCQLSFTLNSNKQFNFLHLTQLTHFNFSGCHCKGFLSVLEALPLNQLVHLDISNNYFSEKKIEMIIKILKSMKKLESLNASFDSNNNWKMPKFTGEILTLSSLKSLDLSGNLDIKSFSDKLSNLTDNSNLEYLNISKNDTSYNKEIFFNLSKFSLLTKLSLPSIESDLELDLLIESVKKLEFIKEIILENISDARLSNFMKKLKEKNLIFKLNTKSDNWFKPTSIEDLIQVDKIDLNELKLAAIEAMQLPDQFNTTSLFVRATDLTISNSKVSQAFFSKFKSLKHLKIQIYNSNSLNYFDLLMKNNQIEKLEFEIIGEFANFEEFTNIFNKYKLKELKFSKTWYLDMCDFLAELSKGEFWKELVNLELSSFTIEESAIIFNNADLSNLQTISLNYNQQLNHINCAKKFLSVKKVNIGNNNGIHFEETSYNLGSLISLFPNVAELNISCYFMKIYLDNLAYLGNLRKLSLYCKQLTKPKEFINSLSKVPQINTFVWKQSGQPSNYQVIYGKHENFKNLFFSLTNATKENGKKFLGPSMSNKFPVLRKAASPIKDLI